ncbi:MAG TPA: hypothetical protein VGQ36_05440 [Thermoanaerobaculia bacterium]|jgi:hypothetical protein|nr:hypothetical protein [Thermoanaerobaculia bacterium]
MDQPIDMKKWRATPAVHGRTATDQDVNEGRAVFAVGGEPVEIELPSCAIVREEEVGEPTPVVVIQVERLEDGTVAVGYRAIDGGAGIATLGDVEFLSEPDERFA